MMGLCRLLVYLIPLLLSVCVQCYGYSLSSVALGGGVEGGQFHIVKVLRAHLIEDLFEGVELTVQRVHVVLVNL